MNACAFSDSGSQLLHPKFSPHPKSDPPTELRFREGHCSISAGSLLGAPLPRILHLYFRPDHSRHFSEPQLPHLESGKTVIYLRTTIKIRKISQSALHRTWRVINTPYTEAATLLQEMK